MNKKVSVVIPVLNEEKNIVDLVKALYMQDYPKDRTEFIFVDGGSKDRSKDLIASECRKKDLNYRILDNPDKTAPYAFNLGIKNASGEIIVIMSAHSLYKSDYITNGVRHLAESDASNVGGYINVVGRGKIGKGIAAMQSSVFGVGATDYRLSRETKYVDTVPFGTFYRSLVDEIGYYNVELPRNEDNECNHRIIESGRKILLVTDMEITYFCRETIKALVENGLANGSGVGYTAVQYPGVLSLKYFVPLAFVCSLVGLPVLYAATKNKLFKYAFVLETGAYALLDAYFSSKADTDIRTKGLMLGLFPAFHISYGIGTVKGLIKGVRKRISQ